MFKNVSNILQANFLNLIILVLGCISVVYLVHGFSNLLIGDRLPVDLALRYWQTKDLIFNQINIYAEQVHAQYPPSFFLFLSPVMGFTSYRYMNFLWLFVNVLSLVGISISLIRFSSTNSLPYKALLLLSFLSFHSIPHGLGVGQVSLLILACLMLSIVFLSKKDRTLLDFILGTFLLSISLGKYSLLIPFALILLFQKQFRKATLIAIVLNLFISGIILHQVGSNIPEYVTTILSNASAVENLGSLDIQALTKFIGLPSIFNPIFSFGIVVGLLILIYKKKELTLFDQLALASLTARFFIYHAHYDNVILVFVLIALWNRTNFETKWSKEQVLFGLFVISLIIPARFLEWGYPFYGISFVYQLSIWGYSGFYLSMKSNPLNHSGSSFPRMD